MSHRVSPFFPPRLRRDNTKTPKCNATVTHNQPNNENEDDPAQHTLHRLNSGIVDRIFLLLLFCSKSHLSPGDFDFFFNVWTIWVYRTSNNGKPPSHTTYSHSHCCLPLDPSASRHRIVCVCVLPILSIYLFIYIANSTTKNRNLRKKIFINFIVPLM